MPPIPVRPPRIYSDVRRGGFVVAIGDSITGNVAYSQSGGADFLPQPRGSWFTYLAWKSSGRMRLRKFANRGIAGNTSTQMLARFDSEVIGQSPAAVIIAAGTNDVASGLFAVTQPNVIEMAKRARANRIQPILWTVPPSATAGGRTSGQQTEVDRYNRWVLDYAAANGYGVVDAYRALMDHTTGGIQSGYAADYVHPNNAGSLAIADQAIADGILDFFPPAPWPLHLRSNAQGNNLIPNGLFVGDSNADGIADGWTSPGGGGGSGSLATTLETDNAVLGNLQRFAVTGGDFARDLQTVAISTGFSVGDQMAYSGLIKTSGLNSGGLAARARVACTGSNDPSYCWAVHMQQIDLDLCCWYAEFTVPTGTTALRGQIGVSQNTGDGTGTVDFGQVTLVNLTTLGVA